MNQDTGDTVGVVPVAALTQPQHNFPTVGAGFIPALPQGTNKKRHPAL